MKEKQKKTIKENWDIIEELAKLEHEQWAHWQAYLFSKSEWTKNGYLIPKELCKRWKRQIDTPYEKLSEKEKESDREWARKVMDKCLLIIGKEGTIYIDTGEKVTKQQLKLAVKIAEMLYKRKIL